MSTFTFIMISFQANAQCYHSVAQQSKGDKSNQQKIKTVRLKITGMTCAGCANHVSTALKNSEGVIEQSVEYSGDVATIIYNSSKTNPDAILKVVEETGYKAEIIKETKKIKLNEKSKTPRRYTGDDHRA